MSFTLTYMHAHMYRHCFASQAYTMTKNHDRERDDRDNACDCNHNRDHDRDHDHDHNRDHNRDHDRDNCRYL